MLGQNKTMTGGIFTSRDCDKYSQRDQVDFDATLLCLSDGPCIGFVYYPTFGQKSFEAVDFCDNKEYHKTRR